MNRAALSVVLNITEGFLRRRDKETMQFLRYAVASNGELKAAYYIAEGRGYLTSAETPAFIQLNESIARMLRRWSARLQDRQGGGGPGTRDYGRTKDLGRTKDQEPSTKD